MVVMEAARGVRDHKLSYYDAQVWAIVRLNQLSVVFSGDFRDGAILEALLINSSFRGMISKGKSSFGFDCVIARPYPVRPF